MRVTSSEIISDDQGSSIGSVSNYVSRFKKIDAGEEVKNVPEFQGAHGSIVSLPSEWNPQTEKEILLHYYKRFSNKSCNDFQSVSEKIASNINRLFKQSLSTEEIFKKLQSQVSVEDLAETPSVNSNKIGIKKEEPSKVKLEIKEGNYPFIKNRPELALGYLDLLPFVDSRNLCFSADGSKVYVSTRPGCEDCFDLLFNFSPKDEIVFQMFKDQLGDEMKAKKLVLMSRMLSPDRVSSNRKALKPKKDISSSNIST